MRVSEVSLQSYHIARWLYSSVLRSESLRSETKSISFPVLLRALLQADHMGTQFALLEVISSRCNKGRRQFVSCQGSRRWVYGSINTELKSS
jgi:hypothetical protein